MKSYTLILIVFIWLVSIILFWGSISLVGWYADALFLILTTSFLLLIRKKMSGWRKRLISTISAITLLAFAWSMITSIPVKKIPTEKDSMEYGYFISRGNLGLTSGCYGQVHFYKKISYLPFLEIRTKIVKCSNLPYECYLNNC
ncbi:MAG: hypothetical protein KDE33_28460 [Bacteroidetes bacterium]|nr:hypothetical protein [Bacteroidota bacterium]